MRVGVLSDVHGDPGALAAVLRHLAGRVDGYLFLGDFCGYRSDVAECLGLWPEWEIVGVRGNHDQALLDLADGAGPPAGYSPALLPVLEQTLAAMSADHLAVLRTLPVQRIATIAGVVVAMYHGAPWDPLQARIYPDFQDWGRFADGAADVVLLGHTHHALVRHVGRVLVLNPGSVGQPRDALEPSYTILHLPARRVEMKRVARTRDLRA